MINSKEALFRYLIHNFPEFKEKWESEDNYNVFSDGSFTIAGLCAEFSQYYVDEFKSIGKKNQEDLFENIEWLLSNIQPLDESAELSSCIKSCFLENISQTEAGELSLPFMGKQTKQFFIEWHVYP